jgi:hypothetical protein
MMRRAAWIMILVLEKRLRPHLASTQPVEEYMTWFGVRGWLIPSMLHHLIKPGKPHPKVFELERSWPSRPTVIGKKERAMVRQGGRKGMENVSVEAKIPFGVGVKGI